MSFRRAAGLLISRLKASARYRSRLGVSLALSTGTGGVLAMSRKIWGAERGPSPFLRRAWWGASRGYRPSWETLPRTLNMDFQDILARIAEGETVNQSELLPFLSLGAREQRATVNAMLADAYFLSPASEHLAQARVFVERAWPLSNFASELLPLYVRVVSATGDFDAAKKGFKRAGIAAARRGETNQALQFFQDWHFAYQRFERLDRYEYDFDIMNCLDDLAAPHQYTHDEIPELSEGGKIRIACLARGITEVNSILIKIDLELAQHRDRTRFDVKVFVPDQRSKVLSSPQGAKHIAAFEALGCPVVTADDSEDTERTLLDLAARINEFRPHIMLTSAALADFQHYFITALKPAPIQIGLLQGPPPQFAPPTLDWCIAWTRHPLLECPVDSSWVTIYLDWPDREGVDGFSRRKLGLPAEACVLLSGGRPTKFQQREFWTAIGELLTQYPNTYYLAVGPTEDQIPFLAEVVSAEVKPRVRCLGWREDFLKILVNADVVIDTYPNGGGQVVVQAMSMGIPVVAHRNDYLQPFDQNNWSPVEDFLNESDLLVKRGDFASFKQVLAKLIVDEDYRDDAGARCRAQHLKQADPAATVRRCEEIYTQLLEQYSSRRLSSGSFITSSR